MKQLQKAALLLSLLVLAAAIAVGVLRQGGGPNPITDPDAWIKWASDPVTAFMGLVGAAMAGIGAVASLTQLLGPKPQPDRDARRAHDRIRREAADDAAVIRELIDDHGAASADRDAVMLGHVQRLGEQIAHLAAEQGRPLDVETQARTGAALTAVGLSESPELAGARMAVREEDPAAVVDALIASASSEGFERLREAGAIAFGFDVERALLAYRRAAVLNPTDVWTHILLSRLSQLAGGTAEARRHAEAALAAATNMRDRSCALIEVGDVARIEGDLPGARKAYEDSLAMALDLSAQDPENTLRLRDLSISYNKLGDVARAEGDLPGARKAYEEDLAIARGLSVQDPGNTEWLRDLSVSHNKIGDVARAEGDLSGARAAYEDGLAIRRNLSAIDPKNTKWLRDLSVSLEKIGDMARVDHDLAGARNAYEDCLTIRRDLSAMDPKNTQWLRDLSVSFEKLGNVARGEGRLAAASEVYENSLAIRRDLSARDPKNAGWLRDLSVSLEGLGDVAEATGEIERAIALYRESLPIAERLAAMDVRNDQWARDVEITRRRLAELETRLA